MGYLHIDNSYKRPEIFTEPWLYALEKVHGTSAHVGIRSQDADQPDKIFFFSGGVRPEPFKALFSEDLIWLLYQELIADRPDLRNLTIYGEAYGGSCQKMSATYGDALGFVAFDVKVGEMWLNVPEAEIVCHRLGFEFVPYARIPGTVLAADQERDRDSGISHRRGRGHGHKREGVVLRPLTEKNDRHGSRVIAKHKRAEFTETKKPREVNAGRVAVLQAADEIAEEWVTPERLRHVLDAWQAEIHAKPDAKGDEKPGVEQMSDLIRKMRTDVHREAAGEVVWSPEAERAVGTRSAKLFKAYLAGKLDEHEPESEEVTT
jgi:hypothetical protein